MSERPKGESGTDITNTGSGDVIIGLADGIYFDLQVVAKDERSLPVIKVSARQATQEANSKLITKLNEVGLGGIVLGAANDDLVESITHGRLMPEMFTVIEGTEDGELTLMLLPPFEAVIIGDGRK